VTVLCLVEHESGEVVDASAAALTFARAMAQPLPPAVSWPPGGAAPAGAVTAILFGAADQLPVRTLAVYGVSDVYAVESDRLVSYAPLAWARVLAELIKASSADAVVAAGTDRGNEVLAHLGAITGEPMVAGCVSAVRATAEFAGEPGAPSSTSGTPGAPSGPDGAPSGLPGAAAGHQAWQIVRQRWAGSLLEDAELDASPALLTVAYDAVAAAVAPVAGAARVRIHTPAVSGDDLAVRVIESAKPSAGVSLATARVVVGGGRGVGGPEGFAALEELAGLLGGAVGVSRVVTSQGWRPHTQQVGQTGTRIAPELYLACGISGAIQHMAGCLGAKHIVVINTDADAPIIGHADYAVIGDLREVIPALVAAIRARAGSS
jgi:electron transfer flavoprotein alpha subunit